MKKRIFASICAVALACLLVLSACVVGLVYQKSTRDGFATLRTNALYLSAGYEMKGPAFFDEVSASAERITLVKSDGAVLFDNWEDAPAMENHAARPEIADALATGTGQTQRQSDTFGERLLYHAVALPDGNVLRVALAAGSLLKEALRFVPVLLLICAGLVLLAMLAAGAISKKLLEPINNLDLDAPLNTKAYDELAPVLRRIAAQQSCISAQMAELRTKQMEFEVVTDNMDEGLIVLNPQTQVLSINQSARQILDATGYTLNMPLLAFSRSLALDEAVKQALNGHSADAQLESGGRIYRIIASPTGQNGMVTGAILLFVDDTDKLKAEQMRREFTANVSHELKTPLTSISGYAELIETGLAKPDNVASFAKRIHSETSRLISLVEDIIKLSQLDEKGPQLQLEETDLLELAKQVAASLEGEAKRKGVALSVQGDAARAKVAPSIIIEVLYNLMDNAIRYSPKGAAVQVTVTPRYSGVTLTVQDNGPGIPKEHQDRVFERFYRVDKSHSRQSGGTGLGLSIVKNGALYHGGAVELQSIPGEGSTFTVTLPG